MIIEELSNIKSGREELYKFGVTMSVVLVLLGGASWWRAGTAYIYLLPLSLFFLVSGIFAPGYLKYLHRIWMSFAVIMGWIMTPVIMLIVFYLLFCPIGFMLKLRKHGHAVSGIDKKAESYWNESEGPRANASYEAQF